MTKLGGAAGWAGRDRVADLDLAISHDDTGDQPLDQQPPLLSTGMLEALAYAVAELFHAQPKAGDFDLAIRLRIELARLPSESLLPLLQVAPPTLVFLQVYPACQVSLGQSLELPLEAGLPASEGVAACLKLLRQPTPAMGPLKREADRLGVG
jgi:hypothetical protein